MVNADEVYEMFYIVEKVVESVKCVGCKNNWTNSNPIKMDIDNKENIYSDDDGEYTIYCHVCDELALNG